MTWNQRLAHGAVANVRAFAERLQDDAVGLLMLTLKLSTAHPRTWSVDDRARVAEVAEMLLRIEDGANKARYALERPAKRRSGSCREFAAVGSDPNLQR